MIEFRFKLQNLRCPSSTGPHFLAIALLLVMLSCSRNEPDRMPLIETAHSFAEMAQQASVERKPIVILVSQHDCQYCELLRTNVLHPLLQSGDLQSRALLREISIDPGFSVEDFDGTDIGGRQFAARYDGYVTPTLVFLDAGGKQLTENIVGISNIEFYEHYLDRAIQSATENMQSSDF